MFDPLDDTPFQAPTLTELEEARAEAELARWQETEALMASPDEPDLGELLGQLVDRPWWHRWGACWGMGTDAFFPRRGESIEPAVAVCEGCEVRRECIASALELGDKHGIWGGLSERSRRQLRRGAA